MANRRRYDDKFRASAVVMLEAAGYPGKEGALTQVAKHLGIPRETLRRWAIEKNNPAPPELVTEKKKELVVELRDLAYLLVKAAPEKIDGANLQQTITSLGIAIDKMQLLEGKPTQIVDDASLTDRDRANRITELLDTARERRIRQTSGEAGHPALVH